MGEQLRREQLNIRWPGLAGLLLLGSAGSIAIARLIPAGSIIHSYLFLAFAIYGLVFAGKGILKGLDILRDVEDENSSLMSRVFGIANMRREIVRAVAHLNVFVLGLLSIKPPSWFGTFFIASMFFLVYALDLNGTLDDTLEERLEKAQALDIARRVEQERLAKMVTEHKVVTAKAKAKKARSARDAKRKPT